MGGFGAGVEGRAGTVSALIGGPEFRPNGGGDRMFLVENHPFGSNTAVTSYHTTRDEAIDWMVVEHEPLDWSALFAWVGWNWVLEAHLAETADLYYAEYDE